MKLTKAEWRLMNALWQGYPATAREIAERVPKSTKWAYTTVKTMLSRLVAKGALKEAKRGNASIYQPRVTRSRARLQALKALAGDAFDGAFGTLVHFLVEQEKLSETEREKLLEILDERGGDSAEGSAK